MWEDLVEDIVQLVPTIVLGAMLNLMLACFALPVERDKRAPRQAIGEMLEERRFGTWCIIFLVHGSIFLIVQVWQWPNSEPFFYNNIFWFSWMLAGKI
jgi:hypothetical protein